MHWILCRRVHCSLKPSSTSSYRSLPGKHASNLCPVVCSNRFLCIISDADRLVYSAGGRFSARSSAAPAVHCRHHSIDSESVFAHTYTQTTQIYGSCRPSASLELQNNITSCVGDVASWMRSNRLQLNTAKIGILWSATGQRSHQLPQSPLRVGNDEVMLASSSVTSVSKSMLTFQ